MAENLFVDASYQGIDIGRGMPFEEVAAQGAYLHSPAPMPVGSVLVLGGDKVPNLTVRVTRVSEQVTGTERPAGMFVEPVDLSSEAQACWDGWVAGQSAPEPVPQSVPDADTVPMPEEELAAAAAATAPAAEPGQPEVDPNAQSKGKAKKKRNRRKKSK